MLDRIRLFTARALFALVAVMSLGLGLLLAGVAAVIGVLMIAALRILAHGADRAARQGPADGEAADGRPEVPDGQPA